MKKEKSVCELYASRAIAGSAEETRNVVERAMEQSRQLGMVYVRARLEMESAEAIRIARKEIGYANSAWVRETRELELRRHLDGEATLCDVSMGG